MPRIRKAAAEAPPARDPAIDALLAYEPRRGVLPPVLTVAAVKAATMPALGQSALPASLEQDIPPAFRYWLAPDEATARSVRDELVERGVVKARDVLIVDGVARAVLWKAFLTEHTEAAELAQRTAPSIAGALRCVDDPEHPTHVAWIDGDVDIAKAIEAVGQPAVLAMPEARREEALKVEGATVFGLETRPGVVYVATAKLAPDADHVVVSDRSDTHKSHQVRLVRKADDAAEERYVLGVVLEPDVVDSQGDHYNAAEVRKAAHYWMENQGELGRQHEEIVTGKLRVLENYVAPVDFVIGTESVKKGTWLMAIRVVDDELWSAVKAGSYSGFSIGGTAIRQPSPGLPEASAT